MTVRRLVFVAGKGGVGKTTVACALAAALAGRGLRTLLVSTDPAHSIGDLFGQRVGPDPIALAPALWAVEIDAEAVATAYVDRVRADAHRLVSSEVRATVDRHLDLARQAPGTLESALVDRLADLVDRCPGDYDRIVVDTAPTGHALRLLALPDLLTGWIRGLVRQRERARGVDRMLRNLAGDEPPPADPVLERLRGHQRRLDTLRERLRRDAAMVPVLVPERLPIAETGRLVAALHGEGLTVTPVVVNRVLPGVDDGAYLRQRREQQLEHLAASGAELTRGGWVEVPQLAHDVRHREDLEEVVDALAPLLSHLDPDWG